MLAVVEQHVIIYLVRKHHELVLLGEPGHLPELLHFVDGPGGVVGIDDDDGAGLLGDAPFDLRGLELEGALR